MANESASLPNRIDRIPPYSEEAERGVLGSVLLDAMRVLDLCVESQLESESFYVPAHRLIFKAMLGMRDDNQVIDVLTLTDRLKSLGRLDDVGGAVALDRLIDSTPTAAHAGYYIDIVRQKFLLRSIIHCARAAESRCYGAEESADQTLSEVEQSFLDITEHQHGGATPVQLPIRLHLETCRSIRNEGCHHLQSSGSGVLEDGGQLFNPQGVRGTETAVRQRKDRASSRPHHLRAQWISPGPTSSWMLNRSSSLPMTR